MPKSLIINADDFGFTPGITEGILQAYREGVLTSTSAMVNMLGAPERIARARAAAPGLGIGLHLNVTAGRPVLPPERVPTLVDSDGRFLPMVKLIDQVTAVSLDELRAELSAQAALLVETGGPFDHIDYHQMLLSLYQPFYPVVIDLAQQYRVPVRNPAFNHFHRVKLPKPAGASRAAILEMFKLIARRPLYAFKIMPRMSPAGANKHIARLQEAGVKTTDWFIADFFDNALIENFLAILEQLPEGVTELMCHAGRVDQDLLDSGDGYTLPREKELAILLDPRVREAVDRLGIQLVNFTAA